MRISADDRERAMEELRRHRRAGRLDADADAYAVRVEEAASAETLADLDHALRDLPRMRIPAPAARPPRLRAAHRGEGAGAGPPLDALGAVALLVSAGVIVAGAVFVVLAHWVGGVARGGVVGGAAARPAPAPATVTRSGPPTTVSS